jgi:hypothetical protein
LHTVDDADHVDGIDAANDAGGGNGNDNVHEDNIFDKQKPIQELLRAKTMRRDSHKQYEMRQNSTVLQSLVHCRENTLLVEVWGRRQ